MKALLTSAARDIDLAGSRPISEVETVLSGVVALVSGLPAMAKSCAKNERDQLRLFVLALCSSIDRLHVVTERSSAIFRGYARRAGSSAQEYTPGGIADVAPDPAFVALSI